MTKEITSAHSDLDLHTSLSLRDGSVSIPPERVLQAIWFHQRIRRSQLKLVDGRSLRVLHPGFWNHEAGPDFRRAMVQIDEESPQEGDVEVDLQATGWTAHHHRDNPNYSAVILHVVWKCSFPRKEPVLELAGQLEEKWETLAKACGTDFTTGWPPEVTGQCRMPLQQLDDSAQAALLRQESENRFHAKAMRMECKAMESGWESALWTFVFRALGYKQNVWPMQRLGEIARELVTTTDPPEAAEARLLGVAGLLPHELRSASDEAKQHHRTLWDSWWRERDRWQSQSLPRSVWRLYQIRPANHPQRRLALAAHWLCDSTLLKRLESWLESEHKTPSAWVPSLMEALQVPKDPFWSFQWTLRSARSEGFRPLIGKARMTDLAINVFLPWMWIRARKSGNSALVAEAERRYFEWPQAQDNAILRLARLRLLKGEESRRMLRSAAAQQGLMQIVSHYCDHSNALCEKCPFPELVREKNSRNSKG